MKYYVFDVETFFTEERKKLTEKREKYGNINFGLAVVKRVGGKREYVFTDLIDFRNFIFSFINSKSKEKTYFIGFNIFNFDVFTFFTNYELIENFNIVLNQNYRILALVSKNKNFVLYDLYNIFSTSLKKLGEIIGIEKGNMQKELSVMGENEFRQRINEIIEYCKRDVEITERVFIEFRAFLDMQGIEGLPLTASQMSFKLYNKLNKNQLDGRHIKNDYLFLETYYGGRTEYFYIGKYYNNVYAYDFNSLYPYVMVSHYYPFQFIKSEILPDFDDFKNMLNYFEGIGLFEIYANDTIYYISDDIKVEIGLLPYKYKNKIIYPKGHWIGFYNLNEIKFALENGYFVKPLYIEYWEKNKLPNIEEFVYYWYNIKKSKKGLFSVIAKIVLNSLYGKFMQINQGYDLALLKTEEDYMQYIELEEGLGIGINRDLPLKRGRSTFLNIGSYITSWARIELMKKMKEAIKKDAKILYCDTDSLFLNKKVLSENDEIGKLKIEKEAKNINIISAKSYILNFDDEKEKKITIKGIPKRAIALDEFNYKYDRIIRLMTFLRENSFYTLYENKTITYDNEKRDYESINSFTKIKEIDDNVLFVSYDINISLIENIRKKLADKGYMLNVITK
ncbi:MAG: DNA polymerase [Minisyncoccia bacterium]